MVTGRAYRWITRVLEQLAGNPEYRRRQRRRAETLLAATGVRIASDGYADLGRTAHRMHPRYGVLEPATRLDLDQTDGARVPWLAECGRVGGV